MDPARRAASKDWQKYNDLYEGQHWPTSRPSWRASIVENVCFSTVETVIPRLLKNHSLGVNVVAKSEELAGVSDIYNRILNGHLYIELELDDQFEEFLRDGHIYGTAIMRTVWDNTASNGIGEVRTDIIHPKFFRIDPRASRIADAEWCGTEMPVSVETVVRTYPKGQLVRNAIITTPTSEFNSLDYASEIGKIIEGADSSNDLPFTLPAGFVLLRDMWLKDSTTMQVDTQNGESITVPKYPGGRHIVECNGVILLDEPNRYEHGKPPYSEWQNYKRADSFWGNSEFKQIATLQIELNKRRSQIAESLSLMANPVWIVDREAGIKQGSITNKPGLIIKKNRGSEVTRDQGDPVSNDVFNSVDSIKMSMDGITGIHDVMQGRRPTGISAASAIVELQENADYRVERKAKRFGNFRRRLAFLMCSMVTQFYTEQRAMIVVGPDGAEELLKFDPNQNGRLDVGLFQVLIESGVTLPMSRNARFSQAVQLAGITCGDGQPAIDRDALLEAADWPSRHKVKARMEERAQQAAEAAKQPRPADIKVNLKAELGPNSAASAARAGGVQAMPEVTMDKTAKFISAQTGAKRSEQEMAMAGEMHDVDVIEKLGSDKKTNKETEKNT